MSAQSGVDAHSIVGGAVQRELEAAEEPGGPRDGVRNKSELTQRALPAFAGHALGATEIREDLGQGGFAMRWQFDGLS
jgi:hypothetical protein